MASRPSRAGTALSVYYPTMIRAAFLLCFLPLQVVGLITTDAKCLAGYDWMFSSIMQSPCDVAAELAAVCAGGQFNLEPLDSGYVYAGLTQVNQNSCRCSSVYYSLLSACAYCQGRNYLQWSLYSPNCTTVYVGVYNQQIPVGVKVPAYAYQNISNTFNVTLAQSMGGIESSRPSSSSTSSPVIASTTGGSGGTSKNTPAIVGGVVGGIVCLGVLVLISYFLLRRRKPKLKADNQNFQLNTDTGYMPNTTYFVIPGPPGSPGSSRDPNDLSKYSPSMNSPYREHSPPFRFQTMTPNDTGVSAQNSVLPQTTPQNTGGRS